MKNPLRIQLSAFIVAALMFSVGANAQIVYTDVNPDFVSGCIYPSPCGAAYSIDLNNDGVNDFILAPRALRFGCGSGCGAGGAAYLGQRDSVVVIPASQSWIADTAGGFDLNTPIDSSLGWTNALHTLIGQRLTCVRCTSSTGQVLPRGSSPRTLPNTGTWSNVSGKYLGLKIQVGTDFYYGWVKLAISNVPYSVSIKIMEYAYNSTPNQPIITGENMVTSVSQSVSSSSIALFPNPANNQFTVDLGSNNQNVKVTVSDITGKKMVETFSSGSKRLEVDTKDLKEGTYVVQIQAENFTGTKRLIISK
jgi:hypothetical protein